MRKDKKADRLYEIEWYLKNRTRLLEKAKKWRLKNKDKYNLIYNYLTIPETLLLNLDRNFKELLEIELKFVDHWINNEKCNCAKQPDIQSRRISLSCEHLKEELSKKTKEKEKEINLKSDALKLRNLFKIQRDLKRFHTL